eukprot:CAMPEP_0119056022 /NCGR_PEP_ID=MMETSP1178-20130426/751_1 /TAXON_ID=33656 /ORGANISM="unid sp, Strain CCMP2000" /LENGTH=80 /DNA_ID=CAMNT_0007036707 /DNA_START=70 /DNA_END=308 /DNA_ORIENTATION=-
MRCSFSSARRPQVEGLAEIELQGVLTWLRTPKSQLHSGMLRTILAQNHHAWGLISRDPDQSDHGGLESAGPPSCFWLDRA